MSAALQRVAGAPITWGVCELPDWGYQMAAERVLAEAASLGLRGIEMGPPGFLDRASLDTYQLALAGAFLAIVLHRPEQIDHSLDQIDRAVARLADAGARVLVLAADLGNRNYESAAALSDRDWAILLETLSRARAQTARHGLGLTVHPHYGTAIATAHDVQRLLESSDVALCLDTGHLLVGGADPLDVARRAGSRIGHVHLKDVDAQLAARVRSGTSSYHAAVAHGLYRPLGEGDARIREVVALLESAGYNGWYVIEQDAALPCEPPPGSGPVSNAEACVRFLQQLLTPAPGQTLA
jgi:inosose dehydratase